MKGNKLANKLNDRYHWHIRSKRFKALTTVLCSVLMLLVINECYYLASLQFQCTDKINSGRDLNFYETFSAYQTHTSLWMFGWVVDANTAVACFNKQFHIHNSLFSPTIKDDTTIRKAKRKLLSGKAKRIRLTWRRYNTKASIYLNGSYLSIFRDDRGRFFLFEIPLDYKPGIIDIGGVKLSETVFDYLENKGILSVYTEHCFQKI